MVEDYSIERLQDRMYGMLLPTEISIHSVQVSISTSFFRGKTLRFCFNLIKPQLAESTTYKPSNIHTTHRRAPRSSKKNTCHLYELLHGLILLAFFHFFRQPPERKGAIMEAVLGNYAMYCRWCRLSTRAWCHPYVFTSGSNKASRQLCGQNFFFLHIRNINSARPGGGSYFFLEDGTVRPNPTPQ
jgi:hypothetical protein